MKQFQIIGLLFVFLWTVGKSNFRSGHKSNLLQCDFPIKKKEKGELGENNW
jgi:hypothetical protein